MIRVIAVDLGGVLFAEGKARLQNRLEQEGKDPAPAMNMICSPLSVDLRKGLLSQEEFLEQIQGTLPEGHDAQEILQTWYDSYVLDPDVLKLVQELQDKYTLVVFSGNIKERIEYLDKKYDFRKYFEKEVYTFDTHTIKNDPAFAQALLDAAGVAPDEIVHIDDQEKYIVETKKRGVHIVMYKRAKIGELRNALRALGITC